MISETIIEDLIPTRSDLEQLSQACAGVVFRRCNFEALDMSQLDMRDWRFERCNLSRSHLTGARLEGVIFTNCRASTLSFAGSTLTETVVDGGDFGNTKFLGATLSTVQFKRCKMTGADLSEVRALDVTFEETLLVLAILPKFSFRKAHLIGVDFSDADLRHCDFRDAVLTDCSLRDANISGCRFQGADLRGADLGGMKLTDASRFQGAAISKRQAGDLLGQLGLKVV